MERNIEIKVPLNNPQAMIKGVSAMVGAGPIELLLGDTYYTRDSETCYHKLRVLSEKEAQVILY
jgi:hypothetical protein